MSLSSLVSIKNALSSLNPSLVRKMSEHPLKIALHAGTPEDYKHLEDFFLSDLSPSRRSESSGILVREPGPSDARSYDLSVYGGNIAAPARALIWTPGQPHQFVEKVLTKHQNLGVPLAKSFFPFRKPFVEKTINKTAKDNTLFSLATALPDIIPSIIELPWAVAEFASDSAFLTMSQVRMAFMLAAANNHEIGYREQKTQIAAVIGSAFGWRAIARQLVGKIPFGGGLIAKAAVAYAGTKILGLSLDRYYSLGYTYTREERDTMYADAFKQGKRVAGNILSSLRPDLLAKYAPGLKDAMDK